MQRTEGPFLRCAAVPGLWTALALVLVTLLPVSVCGDDPKADEWVDLLEWAEGVDWNPRGHNWNNQCSEAPGKSGISLKPLRTMRFPLPAILDGDYDLEVEFTRHEGREGIVVFFPVGIHNMQLEASAGTGQWGGVHWIDGKTSYQGNSTTKRPWHVSNNVKHRFLIRVRQFGEFAGFEIDWDDQKNFITWSGNHTRLNVRDSGGWKLSTIRRPWVGSWENRITFSKIRVKMQPGGTIRRDFITQADRDSDFSNGFVRLVGEQQTAPSAGLWQMLVNQMPIEAGEPAEDVWPLITRDFAPCRDSYGAHAPSRLKCPIPKGADSFTVVGYNDASRSTTYQVFIDGKQIHETGETAVAPIKVDIPPKSSLLELLIDDAGDNRHDLSYWCYPRFHNVPADKVTDKMWDGKPGPLKFTIASQTVGFGKLTHNQPIGGAQAVPVHFRDALPCDEFLFSVPNSTVTYSVPAGVTRFSAIGYCVFSHHVRFEVWADTKQIYRSPQAGIIPIDVKLPAGTKTVELKIDSLGNHQGDFSMWCYPRLYKK